MSREIKFRAWDTQNSRMLFSDNEDVEFRLSGGVLTFGVWKDKGVLIDSEIVGIPDCDYIDDPVVMQFTGMYDKNRKEAYDGDIFIGREQTEFGKPDKIGRYKIEWEDAGYVAKLIEGDGCDTWAFFFETNINQRPLTEFEIIGNIYENPELIPA